MKKMANDGIAIPKKNFFSGSLKSNWRFILDVIAALLIFLFLYTGLSKWFSIYDSEKLLHKIPLLSKYATEIAWSVVGTEFIAAFLLMLPRTRKYGFYLSAVLMIAFTGFIGYMMAFTPNLPCTCGGIISEMSWNQHLVFNIVFSLLAVTGAYLEIKKRKQI